MTTPTRALIMAGGRSERMRATAGPLHKALVPVQGLPMLERNIRTLVAEGFTDIVVAVSAAETEIGRYVETHHKQVRILWESIPLGTIGAAREAIGDGRTLLVVNVDNLTTLPLQRFVEFHCASRAVMTIAAHAEPFQIPFGELELAGGEVRRYLEKPVKPVWISSGTYVLERDACALLPELRRTDVPELVSRLLEQGKRISAFRHDAAWIDVNHKEALERAEQIEEFACRL